ncbi:MAG: HisA/HisF-related TIM barrel protein [Acidimicrobiales bacterium]
MDLYPAIDLRAGRCVQLSQGDFERERVYGDDPVAVAKSFVSSGARWIHMVDLDAARTGEPLNRHLIAAVAAAVDVPVQAGGGVRSLEAADALLGAGVARVVIGTAAFSRPGLVEEVAGRHPGAVAVGLDHRRTNGGPDHRRTDGGRREVALAGWQEGSGVELMEAVGAMTAAGAAALVVTDISRDGMLAGPDLEGMAEVMAAVAASPVDVIASGGVSRAEDVGVLAGLEVGGRRLAGVIVGTAIYEGRLTVEEGVARCAR